MMVRLLLSAALLAVLAGCAPFTMYRSQPAVCVAKDAQSLDTACGKNAVQVLDSGTVKQPGYVLGFIEFDDQGQLWDRAQLQAVIDAVGVQTSNGREDYLMVVFVHGWKHNAAVGDSNVASLRDSLGQLSATEAEISRKVGRAPRRIIGVYLGWRGASITPPIVEDLTFWDRKNTAHKVGHGQVSEVLERLELLQRDRLRLDANSRTKLIVVGHSFGGAVVYSALEQILETRLAEASVDGPTPGNIPGFGNLVVLVNPAFEAELYQPLSDLSSQPSIYAKDQLPILAVLTSEADEATGLAFPIGRWFSTWFEKQRRATRRNGVTGAEETIDQHMADVDAVGHFEPYRTHTLTAVDAPPPTSSGPAASPERDAKSLAASSQQWEDDTPGSTIDFTSSVLKRTDNSGARDPFLVVKVDKKLIANHDDIWGPGIRSFITHLILISSQSTDLRERTEHRQAVAK